MSMEAMQHASPPDVSTAMIGGISVATYIPGLNPQPPLIPPLFVFDGVKENIECSEADYLLQHDEDASVAMGGLCFISASISKIAHHWVDWTQPSQPT